jgi:hypothetical protein
MTMHANTQCTDNISTLTSRRGGFVPGTLVHTSEGVKPIEQIRVGDWVLSRLEVSGQQAHKPVTNTFQFEDKEIWEVCYLTPGGETGTIRATAEHQVWVEDVGWQRVECLESFQLMLLYDGCF